MVPPGQATEVHPGSLWEGGPTHGRPCGTVMRWSSLTRRQVPGEWHVVYMWHCHEVVVTYTTSGARWVTCVVYMWHCHEVVITDTMSFLNWGCIFCRDVNNPVLEEVHLSCVTCSLEEHNERFLKILHLLLLQVHIPMQVVGKDCLSTIKERRWSARGSQSGRMHSSHTEKYVQFCFNLCFHVVWLVWLLNFTVDFMVY